MPLLAVVLGGCSSLKPNGGAEADAPQVLKLEVVAPPRLAELLQRHLDLARVNRLAAGEPLQEGELDRLVAAAPQQARALLDTEGYFNAAVDVERVGDGPPPTVRVTVDPGPQTRVSSVRIDVDGPLATAAAAGLAHAIDTREALRSGWPLPVGRPFLGADWSRAKTVTLAGLRAQGWVLADWQTTDALVDAATQRADLSLTAGSGPLFRVGGLRIEGLVRQDAQTVRNIAALQPGAPATEALLLDIQERLQASDLFDRATVSLLPDADNPGATPVQVQLGERRMQEATFGVGVGIDVGGRITLDHVHRRPFGRPWVMRNKLDLAALRQKWDGELSTQTLPRLYRNLVGAGVDRVESGTDVVRSFRVRAGRAQEKRRISRQLYVDFQRSTTTSALGRKVDDAVALQFEGVWRALDDLLLPTRGRVWTGQFGAGFARSDPGGRGPFVRAYARLDAYRPLGGAWFGQARAEVGQVFAGSDVRVPDALRFRAGGGDSVRGYGYRSLTAVENGVDVGGNVLFTASVEAARPFIDRLPQLWGAVFVDVGRAAIRWADLKPAWGTGIGLRYRSPVGPVRLDLAYGQEERAVRLHLSVGVAF